jgi:4-amino-4-deoxy-L-arabinose transferase-like glycosyltransferase
VEQSRGLTADSRQPTASRIARWHWILLALIVAGAFALRVYRLGSLPPGLFCDEAAVGVNAATLLHHGYDEHGQSWPLFIWSFYAFKYPLDIYPSMLWVGLFGLTEFATRFQAALYGTATVPVAFLLGRLAFGPLAGLAAAAALAVMPWHLHFSRIAFSLIGFPFWFGLGVLFLGRALDDGARRRDWLLAAVFFALCFYIYAVSQLMLPVYIGLAVLLCPRRFWRQRRWVLQAAALGLLVALPFVVFYLRHLDRAELYVSQVSILAQPLPLREKLAAIFAENWPVYFGRNFLFEHGDPILRHAVRDHGELYWAFLPWLAVGVLAALWRPRPIQRLLLLWLILYPLGAVVTRETPSASRSILGTLIFAVVAGIGFERTVALARKLPVRALRTMAVTALVGLAAIPLAVATAGYLHAYFFDYPLYAAVGIEGFQYGYRDLLHAMEQRRRPGSVLAYSTSNVNNPYIFELFYVRRPPLRRSEWGDAETDYLRVRPNQLERWYDPDRHTLFGALPTDMFFFDSWDERVDIDAPGGKPAFILLVNPRPKRFIERWQRLGPFPNPGNRNRDVDIVDPQTMRANRPTLIGEDTWQPYLAARGEVELNRYFGALIPGSSNNPEFVLAYLRTSFTSPDARRDVLELFGSRDDVIVWLNGERVTPRPVGLTEAELRRIPLNLLPGKNVLLIKSIETVGDWWFSARIARPDGSGDAEMIFE